MERKKRKTGWLLVLPLVLGCLAFLVLPFFELLYRSVTLGSGAGRTFVALDNYRDLIHNPTYRQASGNTVALFAVSLPLVFAAAFAIALVLQRKRRKMLLQTAVLLPYVMPVVGTVTVLDVLFGIQTKGDSLPAAAGLAIIVGMYLWKNTGYSVLLLLTGLMAIPKEHYESAQMDGASFWRQLWHITVPQMWSTMFFTLVFSMLNAFKAFREILLIGGKHPPSGMYMLQHFLNNCFANSNYVKLSCAAVLMILALLVPFCICYRWIVRREV